MKVLFTTTGRDLEAELDPRFGRAELFAIVDTETGSLEIASNEAAREATQGAGIKAAELAASLGVQVIVTGNCGPKAFEALRSAGIEVMSGAEGTVAQALADLNAGRLHAATGPNVKGHWK